MRLIPNQIIIPVTIDIANPDLAGIANGIPHIDGLMPTPGLNQLLMMNVADDINHASGFVGIGILPVKIPGRLGRDIFDQVLFFHHATSGVI